MTPWFLIRCLPALALLAGCNTGPPWPVEAEVRDPDAAPGPHVTAVSNSVADSDGICRVHDLSATFDTPMDPATIDDSRFLLTDQGAPVSGRVSLDGTGRTARFVPADPDGFPPSRTIVAVVLAGSTGVRSRTGQAMAEDRVWVFSTGWQPCNGRGLKAPVTRTESPPTERTT